MKKLTIILIASSLSLFSCTSNDGQTNSHGHDHGENSDHDHGNEHDHDAENKHHQEEFSTPDQSEESTGQESSTPDDGHDDSHSHEKE